MSVRAHAYVCAYARNRRDVADPPHSRFGREAERTGGDSADQTFSRPRVPESGWENVSFSRYFARRVAASPRQMDKWSSKRFSAERTIRFRGPRRASFSRLAAATRASVKASLLLLFFFLLRTPRLAFLHNHGCCHSPTSTCRDPRFPSLPPPGAASGELPFLWSLIPCIAPFPRCPQESEYAARTMWIVAGEPVHYRMSIASLATVLRERERGLSKLHIYNVGPQSRSWLVTVVSSSWISDLTLSKDFIGDFTMI